MKSPRTPGLWLMATGAILLVAGMLVYAGAFNFSGRLPGDFRYEGFGKSPKSARESRAMPRSRRLS